MNGVGNKDSKNLKMGEAKYATKANGHTRDLICHGSAGYPK